MLDSGTVEPGKKEPVAPKIEIIDTHPVVLSSNQIVGKVELARIKLPDGKIAFYIIGSGAVSISQINTSMTLIEP